MLSFNGFLLNKSKILNHLGLEVVKLSYVNSRYYVLCQKLQIWTFPQLQNSFLIEKKNLKIQKNIAESERKQLKELMTDSSLKYENFTKCITELKFSDVEKKIVWRDSGFSDVPGYEITGVHNHNNDEFVDDAYRRQLQKKIGGQWVTIPAD